MSFDTPSSWLHIRRILSVSDPNARLWYLKTADKDMWSFRALDRNISTQYYERRLAAQREKSALPVDMENSTDPLEYIKNPMMAEFMGFHRDADYNESDFEKALIDNLERCCQERLFIEAQCGWLSNHPHGSSTSKSNYKVRQGRWAFCQWNIRY